MNLPEPLKPRKSDLAPKEEEVMSPAGALAEPNVPQDVRPYFTVVSERPTILPGTGEIELAKDATPIGGQNATSAISASAPGSAVVAVEQTEAQSWYAPFLRRDRRHKPLQNAA